MSDALLGALIGGAIGVFGALLGQIFATWRESRRLRYQRLKEMRVELFGERIYTSQAEEWVRFQGKRRWPLFWKWHPGDLSGAQLEKANLTKANLSGAENLTDEQLHSASALAGATLPDGTLAPV